MSRVRNYLGSLIVIGVSLLVLISLIIVLKNKDNNKEPDDSGLAGVTDDSAVSEGSEDDIPAGGEQTDDNQMPEAGNDGQEEGKTDKPVEPDAGQDTEKLPETDTVSNSGYIKVKGTALYDAGTGNEFRMTGINMDNNTWDPEITPGNRCMDESSYAEIKALGFNTIRFGIAYNMTRYDDFFTWLDENLKWAKEAGLYLELDMHSSQGGMQIREKEATYSFWSDKSQRDEFKDTWVRIAKHYADEKMILAYDLLNEPMVIIDGTREEAENLYTSYMQELIDAIRQVDKNHIICVEEFSIQLNDRETGKTSGTYPDGAVYLRLKDDNLVFDCHTYSPTIFNMQNQGENIPYETTYIVRDEKFVTNVTEVRNETENGNRWFTLQSQPALLSDASVNTGVIKLEIGNARAKDEIWFDEIVVYEYNSNQEYLGTAYATDFNESIFKWSKSGSATVVVEEDGEGRMALLLKEFDDGKNFVLKQTVKSQNGMFALRPGHYYQVVLKVKSKQLIEKDAIRVSIAGYKAGFAGNIKEYTEHNFEEYLLKMQERNRPVICNETGCTYPAMQNGGEEWLYDTIGIMKDYGINFCLFAYTGKDFGLVYDSNRDFGTDKCKKRQDSSEALYNALHQN